MSLLLVSPVPAADLFLNDEPEVYAAIEKLNALGYLPGLLANTRPYSIRAVRAAVRQARPVAAPGGFEMGLLQWVASYVAPKQMERLTAGGAFSDTRFTPPNNEGIPTPDGWSGWASVSLRDETTPLVNGQLRYTYFHGEGGDNGNRLLDTAIEVGSPRFAVQVGRLSTWYGSGRNGALIFTNNAAPYFGGRIHNPEPIPLRGRFRFLGNVQYDFFAARMEKKEQFSHSILVGTRLAARPTGWLEFGFSRALHYGGEGRDDGVCEFVTDYFGNNESSGRSNSLSAFDITLTLPYAFQPLQFYWERGVDDNSHLGRMFVPWSDVGANILGLYFPRVLRFSRLDLRIEYADTYSGDAKYDNWYSHPAYPHSYRGNILGHPMGGSSRDWFVESRYFMTPDSFAGVSYERVLHDGGDLMGERRSIVSAELIGWFSKKWRGEVHASWDHGTGEEGIPGRDGSDFSAWIALSWQTDRLVPPDEEEVPIREIQEVTK
ncbi:MAG: capsule assembly Wzi family protein [Thermodesulfobacteriota bacterium]|nr:capsule assembly Wzi family protein [Thermodesulfobacteriota bacterium]